LAVLENIWPQCGITSLQIVKLNCCFIHVLCRRERFFLASNYLCTYLTSNYIHTEVRLNLSAYKTNHKRRQNIIEIANISRNNSFNPSGGRKYLVKLLVWKIFHKSLTPFCEHSSKPNCRTMCRVFRSVNTWQSTF